VNEKQAHVVVLIGSPKGVEKSGSARLAREITNGLESAQWSCEWAHTHRVLQSQDGWDAMVASMARADVMLLNCGFVESGHNRYAQLMLRLFCEEMGFQWAGGISLGAGGTVTKRLRAALKQVSESLRDDVLIPDAVDIATNKPIMKPWLYVLGGNFMWRRQGKANGVRDQLKAQPYKRT